MTSAVPFPRYLQTRWRVRPGVIAGKSADPVENALLRADESAAGVPVRPAVMCASADSLT